jgi:hypothetical protein
MHRVVQEAFIGVDFTSRVLDGRERCWHSNQFFAGALYLGVQAE